MTLAKITTIRRLFSSQTARKWQVTLQCDSNIFFHKIFVPPHKIIWKNKNKKRQLQRCNVLQLLNLALVILKIYQNIQEDNFAECTAFCRTCRSAKKWWSWLWLQRLVDSDDDDDYDDDASARNSAVCK